MSVVTKIDKQKDRLVKYEDTNSSGAFEADKDKVLGTLIFSDPDGNTKFNTIEGDLSIFTKDEIVNNIKSYAYEDIKDKDFGENLKWDDKNRNGIIDNDENGPIFEKSKDGKYKEYSFKQFMEKYVNKIQTTTNQQLSTNQQYSNTVNNVGPQMECRKNIAIVSMGAAAFLGATGNFCAMNLLFGGVINSFLNDMMRLLQAGFNYITKGSALDSTTTSQTVNGDAPAGTVKETDEGDGNSSGTGTDTGTTKIKTNSVTLTERDNKANPDSKVIEIDVDLRYEYADKKYPNYDTKLKINKLLDEYRSKKTSEYRKDRIVAQIARLKKLLDEDPKDANRKLSTVEREDKINVTLTKFGEDANHHCSDEGIKRKIFDGMTLGELKEKINRTIDSYNNAKTEDGKFQLACTIAQLKSAYYQLTKSKKSDANGTQPTTKADIDKICKELDAARKNGDFTKIHNIIKRIDKQNVIEVVKAWEKSPYSKGKSLMEILNYDELDSCKYLEHMKNALTARANSPKAKELCDKLNKDYKNIYGHSKKVVQDLKDLYLQILKDENK